MFKKIVAGATLGATTLLWASPVSAQDLDSAPQAVVDNLWLVIAGAACWEAVRKTTYPAAAWAALARSSACFLGTSAMRFLGARRGGPTESTAERE